MEQKIVEMYDKIKNDLLNGDLSKTECLEKISELKKIENEAKEKGIVIIDPVIYENIILPD